MKSFPPAALDEIMRLLRREFGPDLGLSPVPIGLAIAFDRQKSDGDRYECYLVCDDDLHLHIEDDGMPFPLGQEVWLEPDLRPTASFADLLVRHDLVWAVDACEIHSRSLSLTDLPQALTRFLACLIELNRPVADTETPDVLERTLANGT